MKYIIFITLLSLSGCSPEAYDNYERRQAVENSRITLVEWNTIGSKGYYIIKVDDKEFICNGSGGLWPLDNCE